MPSRWNPLDQRPFLGCIADDVTGATDLATNLVEGGMSVVQWLQIPSPAELLEHPAQAVIVALKTRSVPPERAAEQSLLALEALRAAGCQRYYFKYCSTFDSTPRGNIGPVTDALLQALGLQQTVYCPAFPRVGRTVYRGHLFVGNNLLNESGMELHPLNPMTDSNLVRYLSLQTPQSVGLLDYATIELGPKAIRAKLCELKSRGVVHVVVDCLSEVQLAVLADAFKDLTLLTGGSGIARFLPSHYGDVDHASDGKGVLPAQDRLSGRRAIISGSCSTATIEQVATARAHCVCWEVNAERVLQDPGAELIRFSDWVKGCDTQSPILVYSSADAVSVQRLQTKLGRDATCAAIEAFNASVAWELTEHAGVRTLVVAGGETSGAVVNALGVRALRIGREISPGVPWTKSIGPREYHLALKSGNFGDSRFFLTALGIA